MREGDCGNCGSDQIWPSNGFQAAPSESQSSVATMEGMKEYNEKFQLQISASHLIKAVLWPKSQNTLVGVTRVK